MAWLQDLLQEVPLSGVTLEKLLLTVGRSISNKLAKRIFAGMGPLHSLSSKVEILFLFEQIDEILFRDLMVVKDVRNAFAHTTRYVSFSDEEIVEKCRRLSTWTAGADPEDCFYQRSLGCVDVLANKMSAMMYAKALREPPSIVESDD
jgi:DNA-binding MltR family transcriptional regulator